MATRPNGAQPFDVPAVPFYDLSGLHAELAPRFVERLDDLLHSNAFVGGEWVDRFEAAWADYCGVDHAIGVANGTDAIELILRGLGIGPGDEVIVPANTFVASAGAVVATGATPVFVDVDPGTLLLGPDNVRAAVTERTAAVLAVHLYGQPVEINKLRSVTDRLGIPIVEDAAQAHGAEFEGRRAGGLGVAAAFSFYPGKNLGALGDGGAVTTGDPVLAERVRLLANHGRGRHHHDHRIVGRNSRLDGLQAAFLLEKLPLLDNANKQRRAIASEYRSRLADAPIYFVDQRRRSSSAMHLLVAQVDNRDDFREELARRSIGTGIHYPIPVHRQPAYETWTPGFLPVVERAAARIVSLPLFPDMTEQQLERALAVIAEVLEPRTNGGTVS